jgi:ureidoglycolate hydrolase
MWKSVKIKIERLRPEYFAPYGHLITSLEERRPDIVKGNHSSYEKHAYAEISAGERKDGPEWYAADKNRTPLSEGLKRGHFAYHTDAGQSFFPENGKPTVYIVGGVGEPLRAEEMRAFYGEGRVGVCLHLGVWHTMPMSVDGEELYTTIRGDQDYHEHSVEVEFDLQQGLVIEPDLENFDPHA